MVVFNVIRVHIAIKVDVAKHSWTSWPRPQSLCPYEAFSKVGDYADHIRCEAKPHTVEQVGGLSCEVGGGSDVLVVASDGGDVVAGGGVVVGGGGGGVMMVSCGHAELLVWNLTSARCNQPSALAKLNCRVSNLWIDSPCMQYLTRCSQDL